jgi:DNA-binding CsgD family transcriptional regulator
MGGGMWNKKRKKKELTRELEELLACVSELEQETMEGGPVDDGNQSGPRHRPGVRNITAPKTVDGGVVENCESLEQKFKKQAVELAQLKQKLRQESAERRQTEGELETRSKNIEELNTTLKVLIRQRGEERKDLEERFMLNVKELILPYVEKIRKGRLDARQALCIGIIETHLNEIVSPFLETVRQFNLSPRETQVLTLIKDGRTTKEIAEIIGVAPSSIDTHRNNIRTKLNLNNKGVNLQSFLRSIK